MNYPLLIMREVKRRTFRNNSYGRSQLFVFCLNNNEWYIMAKSVVRGIIETNFQYDDDPYIDKIISILKDDVIYFDIRDKELLLTVWDSASGKFDKVTFVKVDTLLNNLALIFNELSNETLQDINKQLVSMLGTLS